MRRKPEPIWHECLPLDAVDRVTFFKRDEITTDLICCDVHSGSLVWFCHEEDPSWPSLLEHLGALPGFDMNWFAKVSQPPFSASETIAWQKG
ncbi:MULTISPECIES: hypothetical protein [Sphingomonas]|uniref:hypothetical protein n=1 Tax=Sphingomonas TaxID=13687 RepID=UPI00082A5727|nr:hypothetical protein [Sphingomonas sp. CCH10-B3]MBA3878458.1 hypothetical protein [Sphingobium sp.]